MSIRAGTRAGLGWVAVLLFLTLTANDLSIALVSWRAARHSDQAIASQLNQLKRSSEPIAVRFNRFTTATRYRFQREGIHFIEVSELPCDANKKTTLAYSQAAICSEQLKRPVNEISDSRSVHTE